MKCENLIINNVNLNVNFILYLILYIIVGGKMENNSFSQFLKRMRTPFIVLLRLSKFLFLVAILAKQLE